MAITKLFILSILSLSLTACASSGSSTRPTTSDQTRTRQQGVLAGALIGGLLGAVTGNSNDRARNTLIGAAVGGGLGYVAGNEIAKRKARYASDEAFLDAEIASTRSINDSLIDYNSRLRGEIAALDNTSRSLQAQYQAGLTSRDALQDKQREIAAHIARNDELIRDMREEYEIKLAIHEDQRSDRSGGDPQVAELAREVELLRANIDQLQSGSTQLAEIDARLEV